MISALIFGLCASIRAMALIHHLDRRYLLAADPRRERCCGFGLRQIFCSAMFLPIFVVLVRISHRPATVPNPVE